MTNNTFINNFAEVIKDHIVTNGRERFLKEILKEDAATFTLKDGTEISCMKIGEILFNKKRKFVQTELMFYQLDPEYGFNFLAVMYLTSTVNNTSKPVIQYGAFRDIKMREVAEDDPFRFMMAFKFFDKFPGYNNLLSFVVNVRNENGNLLHEEITANKFFNKHPVHDFKEMNVFL